MLDLLCRENILHIIYFYFILFKMAVIQVLILLVQSDFIYVKYSEIWLVGRLQKVNLCTTHTENSTTLTDRSISLTFHILSLDLARLIYHRQ